MTAVELLGWTGTVTGTILGLPQAVRLLRTGRVDGLSMTAWQAMLVINLIWTAHGLRIGQAPQVLTSALSLCATLPILHLLARKRERHLLLVMLPSIGGACALIGVDQFLGPAAFGSAAIVPAVVANAGQSLQFLRAPHIVGVSGLFLALAVLNQGVWLSWATAVPDPSTVIAASVTGTITVFNLTWWWLRTRQVPPGGERSVRRDLPGRPSADRAR
ncbi:SemiSWEET family sugar transporter [Paractinoplanes rishiriensis]|uniref:PQ loop repeat protein n=1 Tax=Paractinoplanes rishiriensis TaxID=1050105 RepID=A0A919JUW2_9ACTN|nr:PQ-loop domain-containing transporter [Actinoplanes rishiriensis]GIE95250.1 hypothetical protein Ari01nite_27150 [Actinoplanes rishiriensis]